MAIQFQLRRDLAANWTSINPTLASGEIGLETDTSKFKIGDGSTAWSGRPYVGVGDASTNTASSVDAEIILFSGTTGKILKRATGTGVVHATSGVYSAANVVESEISTSDVTTLNVSSTKHGFAPKTPGDATQFLNGAATNGYAQVKDSDLSTSDVTTNNASTSKHGFVPKLPNDATKYYDGTGAFGVPAGGGGTPQLLFALITSSSAISNTTSETAFNKTYSLPGNTLAVGDRIRVTCGGTETDTAAPQLRIKIRIGTTAFMDRNDSANTGTGNWQASGEFVCRATGGSGTLAIGPGMRGVGGDGPWSPNTLTTLTFTKDTTVSQTIDVTAAWNVANASNSVTMTYFAVERWTAASTA